MVSVLCRITPVECTSTPRGACEHPAAQSLATLSQFCTEVAVPCCCCKCMSCVVQLPTLPPNTKARCQLTRKIIAAAAVVLPFLSVRHTSCKERRFVVYRLPH
ncbi:hypothetical protein CBL_12376 [Carabus blaptoides fortunei]